MDPQAEIPVADCPQGRLPTCKLRKTQMPQQKKKQTPVHVFYSWQSDSPPTTNLNAIRTGLDKAFKLVEKAHPDLKLVRDEATRDTSGSPNIASKILEKIEAADVFVADITTVTSAGAKRPCPNPNVSYELGYAVAMLGWDRIILLFNQAIGSFPKDVPFDFIQNRISDYQGEEADLAAVGALLTDILKAAIGAVIAKNPKRPAELRGLSPEKIRHDHDVENMTWLMNSLHLPTLDQLIQELPHMITNRSIWFFENFKGVVANSLFSLYDKGLDDAVGRLYRAWATVLSHDGQYHELRSGTAHVFHNPGDMPLSPSREAIWKEIDAARYEMRRMLDFILDRLRSSYIEISIHKTNKRAFDDYIAFRKEVEALDDEPPTSKKKAKRKAHSFMRTRNKSPTAASRRQRPS